MEVVARSASFVSPPESGDPELGDDCLYDIDRAAQERFRSLWRAECRMGRQCHVLKFRQLMILRQRLTMEDIQPSLANMTALQRRYQGCLVGERSPCSV